MNYLAIIVAGILAMVLGALWFGPLFGNLWMKIIGINAKDKKAREEMQKSAGPLYFIQFLLTLLQIGILYYTLDSLPFGSALKFTALIYIGFIIPILAANAMWNNDSAKVSWSRFLIQAGNQALSFGLFILIYSIWP